MDDRDGGRGTGIAARGKRAAPALFAALGVVALSATPGPAAAPATPAPEAAAPAPAAPATPLVPCPTVAPDPFVIDLLPTRRAGGAAGRVDLRFAPSPFGVALTRDGTHDFAFELRTQGLEPPEGTVPVAWATTPDLAAAVRLGTLDAGGALAGRIALNKFLVFVTAEAEPGVERWTGPVLLRGSSPSSRMHSMAGHGPFQGEPCAVPGF